MQKSYSYTSWCWLQDQSSVIFVFRKNLFQTRTYAILFLINTRKGFITLSGGP